LKTRKCLLVFALIAPVVLQACQTNNAGQSQSTSPRNDPEFAELFERIDKLWAVDQSGRVFAKPEMTGASFTADTRACQHKALETAKLTITLDDTEKPITSELQAYLDAIAMKVSLTNAIEDYFPRCMDRGGYFLIKPSDTLKVALRRASTDNEAAAIVDNFVTSDIFDTIRDWGKIDSQNAVAAYRDRMKTEPELIYPVDANKRLDQIETNLMFIETVVSDSVLSSRYTTF